LPEPRDDAGLDPERKKKIIQNEKIDSESL